MVEANNQSDVDMSEGGGREDAAMHEVVMKPQTNFSNNALRKVVPFCNLKEKKASLSMSMINLRKSGGSRLFSENFKNLLSGPMNVVQK